MPLVLTRKIGDTLKIGRNISIEVKSFKGRQVQLAIECPRSIEVLRGELVTEAASKPSSDFHAWWVAEYGQPPSPEHNELFQATRRAWAAARRGLFTQESYEQIRAFIRDQNPDALFFEQPDYAPGLIGMAEDGRAVYEQQLCIESLVDEETTWEEASEFFSYNTSRSLHYEDEKVRPIIVSTFP